MAKYGKLYWESYLVETRVGLAVTVGPRCRLQDVVRKLYMALLLLLLWFVTSLALRTCRGWTMQGGLWHTMLPRRRVERSQDLRLCAKSSRKFKGNPNWFKWQCERCTFCTKSIDLDAWKQIPLACLVGVPWEKHLMYSITCYSRVMWWPCVLRTGFLLINLHLNSSINFSAELGGKEFDECESFSVSLVALSFSCHYLWQIHK